MAIISHTFPLPKFESLPASDIQVFNSALSELRKQSRAQTSVVAMFHGIAGDLTDQTREFYDPRQTFFERTEGRYFRSAEWHVDNQRDNQLRLFASSTPTSYAGFELEVDTDEFQRNPFVQAYYARVDTDFSHCRFEPAEVIRVLGYAVCGNWLEVAAGVEQNDRTAEIVRSCGVVVNNLVVVQAKPFQVASGSTRETVHTPSARKKRAPLRDYCHEASMKYRRKPPRTGKLTV